MSNDHPRVNSPGPCSRRTTTHYRRSAACTGAAEAADTRSGATRREVRPAVSSRRGRPRRTTPAARPGPRVRLAPSVRDGHRAPPTMRRPAPAERGRQPRALTPTRRPRPAVRSGEPRSGRRTSRGSSYRSGPWDAQRSRLAATLHRAPPGARGAIDGRARRFSYPATQFGATQTDTRPASAAWRPEFAGPHLTCSDCNHSRTDAGRTTCRGDDGPRPARSSPRSRPLCRSGTRPRSDEFVGASGSEGAATRERTR